MPSILELDDKMLSAVLGNLPRGDLFNIALTCQSFLPIARKVLYTSIDLYQPYADARTSENLIFRTCLLARTLLLRRELADHVWSLSITMSDYHCLQPAVSGIWRKAVQHGAQFFRSFSTDTVAVWTTGHEHSSLWASLLLCLLPNLENLKLEALNGKTMHQYPDVSPYCSNRYLQRPLARLTSWITTDGSPDITCISGLRGLKSLCLIAGELEIEWLTIRTLESLLIGVKCSIPEWEEEGPEVKIVQQSTISEIAIETDVYVTIYGFNSVDLTLLASFPGLRNFKLYMTNLDQLMSKIGPEKIWELDDEPVHGLILDLDQFGLSTTSLIIQPFHDEDPKFMKKVSLLSLDSTKLETLTIPQANLLDQNLPESIQTLGISEPTLEIQDWLSECIVESFPDLKTIILYSLDPLFKLLPSWLRKECEDKGVRSLTLLLHAPETFRITEGGTSTCLK